MQPKDLNYQNRVQHIFDTAAFIQHLGVEMTDCAPGQCETRLNLRPEHMQQDTYAHAGVVATLADHTAGAAAYTLIAPEEIILTVEYKVHLLRPATGPQLRCQAQVVKPGRTLHIVESEVYSDQNKLVSKLIATMQVVEAT